MLRIHSLMWDSLLLLLSADEDLYLDSEDLQSAFNLFRVPANWSPFFAYSRKVHGSAFGRPDLPSVRPALAVIPMGWKSAVTLVQAAVRRIVFGLVKVPLESSIEKGKELPATSSMSVVYLDNFDELRVVKKFCEDLESSAGSPSEHHVKFIEVCDELGLPRSAAKQLIGATCGGIQGGDVDGVAGIIKVGRDKLENFLAISMALLSLPVVSEFQIRHWIGKAAFVAAFRRPLFSVLQEIFAFLEKCKGKSLSLPPDVVDEILCFMGLAVHAQSEMRAEISPVISCTDASPTGGGSAIATLFKNKSLVVPDELPARDVCGCCGADFQDLDARRRLYACPRKCGERFCSAKCVCTHSCG